MCQTEPPPPEFSRKWAGRINCAVRPIVLYPVFRNNAANERGLLSENVCQIASQSLHDLFQLAECDALRSAFQSVERRRRKAELPRELRKGLFAAPLAKKRAQPPVERIAHPARVQNSLFRMWNICIDRHKREPSTSLRFKIKFEIRGNFSNNHED